MLRLINVQFPFENLDVPKDYYEFYGPVAVGDVVDTDKEQTILKGFAIRNQEWIDAFKSADSNAKVELTTFKCEKLISKINLLSEVLEEEDYKPHFLQPSWMPVIVWEHEGCSL